MVSLPCTAVMLLPFSLTHAPCFVGMGKLLLKTTALRKTPNYKSLFLSLASGGALFGTQTMTTTTVAGKTTKLRLFCPEEGGKKKCSVVEGCLTKLLTGSFHACLVVK